MSEFDGTEKVTRQNSIAVVAQVRDRMAIPKLKDLYNKEMAELDAKLDDAEFVGLDDLEAMTFLIGQGGDIELGDAVSIALILEHLGFYR